MSVHGPSSMNPLIKIKKLAATFKLEKKILTAECLREENNHIPFGFFNKRSATTSRQAHNPKHDAEFKGKWHSGAELQKRCRHSLSLSNAREDGNECVRMLISLSFHHPSATSEVPVTN